MSADELVDIVDEEDRVVGRTTRREIRARALRHRSTYILLFNSRNQLFVHQRTDTKDIYPGYRDVTFGGVVGAGEEPDAGARRELAEEAGIEDAPLRRVLRFRYDEDRNHVNGCVYTATYDGPLRLQASEVASGRFLDLDEVIELTQRERFCPDGIEALRLYLDRLNQARARQ
jgi:8-oxo-dGTP pyrophosphatase MutT (NUDIX family)